MLIPFLPVFPTSCEEPLFPWRPRTPSNSFCFQPPHPPPNVHFWRFLKSIEKNLRSCKPPDRSDTVLALSFSVWWAKRVLIFLSALFLLPPLLFPAPFLHEVPPPDRVVVYFTRLLGYTPL